MAKGSYGEASEIDIENYSYCSLPQVAERVFEPDVNPDRLRLIRVMDKKWVNGTVLHYFFFEGAADGEKDVVREAFKKWEELGIGLEFEEVDSSSEAEIRIGFMRGDGAWSYVGRDILNQGQGSRTMNFGWDLTGHPSEIDTAVHEIGHTLGFPHEHQNPNAGIIWDEEAVYDALARPPNSWDRTKTFHNIIRKINPDAVQGSNWDPDSIMHYPFGPGLIVEPEEYRTGLTPELGLSDRDTEWVRTFYPPLDESEYAELKPFQSVLLEIGEGQQRNFVVQPDATRYYEFRTFGVSDTVMVLFENVNGDLKYRTGDDDSGQAYNASLRVKLFKGREYVLRIRLYYSDQAGETAVMMW